MKEDMLTKKGFRFIAKGYKPLCATKSGLLAYHRHALYLYDGNEFANLLAFPVNLKKRAMSCHRILERMTRSEPQSAVFYGEDIFVARRHEILQISIDTGNIVDKHDYRKSYIHTNKLSVIENVSGFSDCIVYGEYQPNAKRESVCIWRKKTTNDSKWENVYSFADGQIRHIHAIVPDSRHGCVYILTGDEDKESGIWRATEDFNKVEPFLVGDQAYRSCIAYVEGNTLYYSTDIPSRQNTITQVDLDTSEVKKLFDLPGSCTVGCRVGDRMIFCTSVETEEPKNRGKVSMLKYMLGNKLPAGIKDRFPRVYVFSPDQSVKNWLKFEKDIWPAGLFRFGRAIPLYDEFTDTVYLYPGSVKKYDGRLYSISAGGVV